MVQTIGFMVGFYIITRMISFLSRKGDLEESNVAKVFFAINIFITLVLMLALLFQGANYPPKY